jgi:hypothetical protein
MMVAMVGSTPWARTVSAALLEAVSIAPFTHARAIQPETPDERYGTTRDRAGGYRVVVFIHVDRQATTCTLAWAATEHIP